MIDASSIEVNEYRDDESTLTVFRYGNVTFLDIGTMLDHLTAKGVTVDAVEIVRINLNPPWEPVPETT